MSQSPYSVNYNNNYDTDYEEPEPTYHSKRRKLSEDERLKRCRERNRIHARNTRERKRIQMENLQHKIHELLEEKMRLKQILPDSSVASILMSLSVAPGSDLNMPVLTVDQDSILAGKNEAAAMIEKIRSQVSALLSDDDEMEMIDRNLLTKDKSTCTSSELALIRRERNRMHAKKTRLRKKKMLSEMEAIISNLEAEIRVLREENVGHLSMMKDETLHQYYSSYVSNSGSSITSHNGDSSHGHPSPPYQSLGTLSYSFTKASGGSKAETSSTTSSTSHSGGEDNEFSGSDNNRRNHHRKGDSDGGATTTGSTVSKLSVDNYSAEETEVLNFFAEQRARNIQLHRSQDYT